MNDEQKSLLRRAMIFSGVYDVVLLLLGLAVFGPPRTTEAITSFKLTATVGLPTVQQLLEPGHQMTLQMTELNPLAVLATIVFLLLFALCNGFYISLLARSIQGRAGTAADDARNAFPTLLIWELFQFVLGLLAMPLMMLGLVGGLIAVIGLLVFRFLLVYFEFAAVLHGKKFTEAWHLALALRKRSPRVGGLFWMILVTNLLLGLWVNLLFGVVGLLLGIALNAVVMTWMQRRLLESFFEADSGGAGIW